MVSPRHRKRVRDGGIPARRIRQSPVAISSKPSRACPKTMNTTSRSCGSCPTTPSRWPTSTWGWTACSTVIIAGAEAQFANAAQRADQLGFPQGPYNHVYAIDMEIMVHAEAGQFDRAGELVANLLELAERYGFDFWQMFGLTEQCLVDPRSCCPALTADPAALEAQISTLTGFVELWRSVGLYAYQTQYDCLLARLLIAAGRPDDARARVDIALQIAEDTGMHYYDVELLRARAHTHTDPDDRAADLAAAIKLARRQDAPLFELRAALDDFELRGHGRPRRLGRRGGPPPR